MTLNAVADPSAVSAITAASQPRRAFRIRLMELRVGIMPRPVCLLLVAPIAVFAAMGEITVMLLTAAGRMALMPFAQAAARIGGAPTVTAAIVAMAHFEMP